MRIIAVLLLVTIAVPARADDKNKVKMDDYTKERIQLALKWLAEKQNTDGSWGDGRYPNNTAITGFAIMAFLSNGQVPGQCQFRNKDGKDVVQKGVNFLMASQRDDGYIVNRAGNMYCHGMATLALSQAWGMTGDDDVKKSLKKAVDLIIKCQSKDGSVNHGGWRYEPVPSGADISVTIMQVMALRGAKDSGIHVPDETMKRALSYINSCYDEATGGYTYQPRSRAPGFARTAAGICVLKLTGEYDKKIDRSIEFLKASMARPREHFWYGHYYACHAMHQVGGKDWEDYYNHIRANFLPAKPNENRSPSHAQSDDGSWSRNDFQSAGPVYQTSIAVIALSVPANYLPIFQR